MNKQPQIVGTYVLQTSESNGYPFWKKGGFWRSKAIWFDDKSNSWMVGIEIGSTRGWVLGPSGNDCWPNEITSVWKFWNGANWQDAEDQIIFTN